MGWASALVTTVDLQPRLFSGSANCGTNNVAEMMAFFWPLFYLANTDAGMSPRGYRVHLITDSQYVATNVNAKAPIVNPHLKSNRELWLAMNLVRRRGLVLTAHHITRETVDLNQLVHDLANAARENQKKLLERTSLPVIGEL